MLCCVCHYHKRQKQSGLRGINGLYLFEIERADGTAEKVVDHDTLLKLGDRLWFAGASGSGRASAGAGQAAGWCGCVFPPALVCCRAAALTLPACQSARAARD